MTPTQQATLKAYIQADPVFSVYPNNSDGWFEIAKKLNEVYTPSFIVWKTRVTQDEIMQNGFDWVQVDNLSVGKARIWEWLFKNSSSSINTSKLNVRAGIDEVWKGTGAMLAIRAAVYVHCKREATVFEKIMATGTGTDVSPASMEIEGSVSYLTVGEVINS